MPIVLVDDQEVELAQDVCLNGIEVARRVGVDIPHYCWHPGLSVVASCRMCLVETGRRDPSSGEISMMPKLVPACQTPATDGTVFVTNSDKVRAARAMVEEDLLIRHPIDCPICDKAGECSLQDYHFQHGQGERRADIKPFTSRRKPLGDTVTLFVDRCVMCSRCVRFTREITETSELMVVNRGAHEEIDVFPGYPLDNRMSGNVVDLCPVGALGDKDFLYQQRVWFMRSHDQVCAGCSTGCSIHVEENQERVYRLKPRENPHINQWWMCDEGRYGFKHVHSPRRVTELRRRDGDKLTNVQWSDAPELIERDLTGRRLAAVLSPHLTVEEAYLLSQYIRRLDPDAMLAVGPVPEQGEDTKFSNGFTIRAEKCPNRRGVEAVAVTFWGDLLDFETFLDRVSDAPPDAVWFTGGYKTNWNSSDTVAQLSNVETLIVQDCFESPLWQAATWQLPGATFAERQGSYVNCNDRLQSFTWAVRMPAGAMLEGQLYWRLLENTGLYQAESVLQDVSRQIAFFAAAADPVPPTGVDLRMNQFVTT